TARHTRKRSRSRSDRPGAPASAPSRCPLPIAQFVRTSTTYDLDWHTAPRRQYVITVSGESEVIIGDGTHIRLYPGHIMLAEDTTGQGHISKRSAAKIASHSSYRSNRTPAARARMLHA